MNRPKHVRKRCFRKSLRVNQWRQKPHRPNKHTARRGGCLTMPHDDHFHDVDQVIGQYELGRTIGEGKFGKVKCECSVPLEEYRPSHLSPPSVAVHVGTGERVAVKIISKVVQCYETQTVDCPRPCRVEFRFLPKRKKNHSKRKCPKRSPHCFTPPRSTCCIICCQRKFEHILLTGFLFARSQSSERTQALRGENTRS